MKGRLVVVIWLVLVLISSDWVWGRGGLVPDSLLVWDRLREHPVCMHKQEIYVVYLPYSWSSCPTLSVHLRRLRQRVLAQVDSATSCVLYFVPDVPEAYRSRNVVAYYLWGGSPRRYEGFVYRHLAFAPPSALYRVTSAEVERLLVEQAVHDTLSGAVDCGLRVAEAVWLEVPSGAGDFLRGPLWFSTDASNLYLVAFWHHRLYVFGLGDGRLRRFTDWSATFHCQMHKALSAAQCKEEAPCDSLQMVRLAGYPLCRTRLLGAGRDTALWLANCLLCDSLLGWKRGHMVLKTQYRWIVGIAYFRDGDLVWEPWWMDARLGKLARGATTCFTMGTGKWVCWALDWRDSVRSQWQAWLVTREGLRSGQILQMGADVDRIVGYWWRDTLALVVYHADDKLVVRRIRSRILREHHQTITLASAMDTVLVRGVRRGWVSGFFGDGRSVVLSVWRAASPDSLVQWRFFPGDWRGGFRFQRCGGSLGGAWLGLVRYEGVVFGGALRRMVVYGGGKWGMVVIED